MGNGGVGNRDEMSFVDGDSLTARTRAVCRVVLGLFVVRQLVP